MSGPAAGACCETVLRRTPCEFRLPTPIAAGAWQATVQANRYDWRAAAMT